VDRVALAVFFERGRGEVRRGAVGLDDQPLRSPEEVDLVGTDGRVDFGPR
jgi:hypothetical protein